MKSIQTKDILEAIYDKLYVQFGPQKWWPAKTPFEMIVGAILTQNTAWSNVEKAIANLNKSKLLSPNKIKEIPLKRLAQLIKPAGYYNIKARRIKDFVNFLFRNYGGSLKKMFKADCLQLRAELLDVRGIGMETADSILLYAGLKPIFVIDAYTRRILSRHNIVDETATYSEIQNIFMDNLSCDTKLFNEYHALIVRLAKDFCKKTPKCHKCPLSTFNKSIKYACDSCSEDLSKPHSRYILKVELYSSPEVEIDKEEYRKESKKEINKLVKQMKNMDPKELEEDIHVFHKLTLCKRCRDIFNKRIKCREFV